MAPSSAASASANRTVSRTCLTQYSGSVTSPAATTGIVGAAKASPSMAARKWASIGSISGEWKACETRSRVDLPNRPATASTASSSPAITTAAGPLTAAIDTPSVSTGSTSASAACSATIAPPAGSARISEARADTSRQASGSDSTPAACAAAISPIECPATWSGVTPNEDTSRKSATSTANSAGCAHPVSSSAPGSAPHITSRTPGSRWDRTSSSAAAKAGNRPYRSRPIPSRWEPWPEKSIASGACIASPRAASVTPPSDAISTARYGMSARPVASEWPMSNRSAGDWPASRATWASSAASDRAETIHGTRAGGAVGSAGAAKAGACSTITWAFVPLMPNEDTPARRGRSTSGHATASVASAMAPADQSTRAEGASTWRVFGTSPYRMAWIILMTPAAPAAAWVWPMFDLTEPSHSGRWRPCPYVSSSACASMGSPSVVPVPCPSTTSTWSAVRRALSRAARMTRCWEGPFGAVRPLDAPSWLTAEPRISASTGWPLRSASESRSSRSTPAPSPHPTPSAASANGLHRPSGASPRCRENSTNSAGVAMTAIPPAKASEHSPERSACAARWSATSDAEQAVSTVTAGPSRPSRYETRPEMTLADAPVTVYPSADSSEPTSVT
ncbi:hypothetical protein GCM10023170_082780 [Phytohabitans houttuyneae]